VLIQLFKIGLEKWIFRNHRVSRGTQTPQMADQKLLAALFGRRTPWYISCVDVDIAGEEVRVTIDHHPGKIPCATCGKACLVEDHSDERVIRHLDM
jgi:hypothetical protein